MHISAHKNLKNIAIILCAGSGNRTGLLHNKILHMVGHITVLEHTLSAFDQSNIDGFVVVTSIQDQTAITSLLSTLQIKKPLSITTGGKARTDSVTNGLNHTAKIYPDCSIVAIHDGARPYVQPQLINDTIESAKKYGSGILAVPAIDTIKQVDSDNIIGTLDREMLYHIQTPQSFRFDEIFSAYNKCVSVWANALGRPNFTDDSEVYQLAGYTPKIVLGDYNNIKLTTPNDFLKPASINSFIGVGFDVHQLVENRPLILGGVTIPFSKGLLGHSDADVLTHAIMDAILSASNLSDIGTHFPDTDPNYKNANSIELLKKVLEKISALDFKIHNISAVIMAEKPKLAPHISAIINSLASVLSISTTQISISATTHEGLGIIGEGKGIASSVSCLLVK